METNENQKYVEENPSFENQTIAQVAELEKIYIKNLPPGITYQDLHELCSQFGEIKNIEYKFDVKNGCHYDWAFVTFSSHTVAQEAILKLNGFFFQSNQLVVAWAKVQDLYRRVLRKLQPGSEKKKRRVRRPEHRKDGYYTDNSAQKPWRS